MSAFNTVSGLASCPNCNNSNQFDVQFKYGDTWQHSYGLGDRIRWGGNDVGIQGIKKVLVEGIGGPCLHCGMDNLVFQVLIENDLIISIEPLQEGTIAFGQDGFNVLEK